MKEALLSERIESKYKKCIENLASKVQILHSFNYRSLEEARQTVTEGEYHYTFDALSLCYYEHNLSPYEYRYFGHLLDEYWTKASKEERKERNERAILFHYLQDEHNLFRDYLIIKNNRPDFILKGELTVGVEVVQLTTEDDKVLESITRQVFGRGLNSNYISRLAFERHGLKAKKYHYLDIGESIAIGTPTFDINERKQLFAQILIKKYYKYKEKYSEYDVFCILASSLHGIGIEVQEDVNEIYDMAKMIDPGISKMMVAILWFGEKGYVVSTYGGSQG